MAGFMSRSNIEDALGFAGKLFYNQIPFATAKALTSTAKLAQAAERSAMEADFDRPTPHTLNSTYVKSATKTDLSAWVWVKDDAGKGTPATKGSGANRQCGREIPYKSVHLID